jgi:hypothetical protein
LLFLLFFFLSRAVVETVLKPRVPWKLGNFLTSCAYCRPPKQDSFSLLLAVCFFCKFLNIFVSWFTRAVQTSLCHLMCNTYGRLYWRDCEIRLHRVTASRWAGLEPLIPFVCCTPLLGHCNQSGQDY